MDKPPEQVEVDGKLYKINSDFRTSIQFEILMQKKELTEKQKEFANELCLLDKEMDRETAELLAKYKDGLELYYPEIPNDINEAINAMLWFYECGKENIDKKKSKKSGSGKKIYNYNYDADYIYAAFFEQYHIDLAEQELHWWKFSALFSALSDKQDYNVSRNRYERNGERTESILQPDETVVPTSGRHFRGRKRKTGQDHAGTSW